jgi:hypothetical protein
MLPSLLATRPSAGRSPHATLLAASDRPQRGGTSGREAQNTSGQTGWAASHGHLRAVPGGPVSSRARDGGNPDQPGGVTAPNKERERSTRPWTAMTGAQPWPDQTRPDQPEPDQTCDRCGPAVRAVYRVQRQGELYLCKHCANRLWPDLSRQGWNIWPVGEPARTACS